MYTAVTGRPIVPSYPDFKTIQNYSWADLEKKDKEIDDTETIYATYLTNELRKEPDPRKGLEIQRAIEANAKLWNNYKHAVYMREDDRRNRKDGVIKAFEDKSTVDLERILSNKTVPSEYSATDKPLYLRGVEEAIFWRTNTEHRNALNYRAKLPQQRPSTMGPVTTMMGAPRGGTRRHRQRKSRKNRKSRVTRRR